MGSEASGSDAKGAAANAGARNASAASGANAGPTNRSGERCVRAVVSGRVQGVFFRASTADRAIELGLRGYVRNLPDGRVEVVAEGNPSAVEALLDFCRTGPPSARVERVEVDEKPAGSSGENVAFRVRH